MKALHSRQLAILTTVVGFYERNSALFPEETMGAVLFHQLTDMLPRLREAFASRAAADTRLREAVNLRAQGRAALILSLDAICLTSQAFVPASPALGGQLRKLHYAGHQALVFHAGGIATFVEPLRERFVSHALAPGFVEALHEAISRYDDAIRGHLAARNATINATAAVNADMHTTLLTLYRLDGIVPIVLLKNDAVLKEWRTARRMKRRGRPPGSAS